MMKTIMCILLVLSFFFSSQESLGDNTDFYHIAPQEVINNIGVYFRQGSIVLEEDYKDNASNLRHILEELEQIEASGDSNIVWPLKVGGYCSPSETSEAIDSISQKRAQAVREWILRNSEIKPEKLTAIGFGIDFEYLYVALQNSELFIGHEQAMEILWNYGRQGDSDNTIRNLKSLFMGKTWSWLETNMFWRLRRGVMICSDSHPSSYLTPTTINFHQGSPVLDEDFRSNRNNLRRIVSEVNRLEKLEDGSVKWPVRINGYVSPEGEYNFNTRLARNRAIETRNWILQHSQLKPERIITAVTGLDLGFLYRIIREANDFPGKKEALDILWKDALRDANPAIAMEKLKGLRDGEVWKWLLRNIFWMMRASAASVSIEIDTLSAVDTVSLIVPAVVPPVASSPVKEQIPITRIDTVWMTRVDTIRIESIIRDTIQDLPLGPITNVDRQRLFAIRSNLLLPLMNVGIEYPVSPHFSLEADWHYPWIWPQKSNKNCFELLYLTAGARWWMRKPRDDSWRGRTDLTGPSIGLEALAGYFDFEQDYKGRQGEFAGVSLDFTWATKLGRSALRMEFTVGAGFVYVQSRKYHVETDGGLLFRDNHYEYINNWFGPTKAAVSLVIPISRKVKTSTVQRKEGRR